MYNKRDNIITTEQIYIISVHIRVYIRNILHCTNRVMYPSVFTIAVGRCSSHFKDVSLNVVLQYQHDLII